MSKQQIAVVTGTSTGIGLSAAIHLARANFRVIATLRDLKKADALRARAAQEKVDIEMAQLDVQDEASIERCITAVIGKHGGIDVWVNNAGAGLVGSTEQIGIAEVQRTMDINFYGVWRCTQAVLSHMRAAKTGRIISISSVGGLIGQPFNDAYCAAKFAVEGMMESLAPVAKLFGVSIVLVEPGPVNTEFVANVMKHDVAKEIPEYVPLMTTYRAGSRKVFATAGQTGDDVAAVIVAAATAQSPHLRYVTSERMRDMVGKKYVDTTGDSVIAMTAARLAPQ